MKRDEPNINLDSNLNSKSVSSDKILLSNIKLSYTAVNDIIYCLVR